MKDIIIPIIFPDYRISINTPTYEIDLFPWTDFDNFSIKKRTYKVENLGHAGVLIINGKSGLSKYYEYGRYDPPKYLGVVANLPIPDAKVDAEGVIVSSILPIVRKISRDSGQTGRIIGVYLEVEAVFSRLENAISIRKFRNIDDNREPYDLTNNSCIHFVKWVVELAGLDAPWMLDPRPNSYIGEFRDDYLDLDYNPKTDKLTIEGKTSD